MVAWARIGAKALFSRNRDREVPLVAKIIPFGPSNQADLILPAPGCSVRIPRANFKGCALTTATGERDNNFTGSISEIWSPSTNQSKNKVYVVRNQIVLEARPASPEALEFATSILFKRFPELKDVDKSELFRRLMEEEE